jgi:hypothetical protein
MASWRNSSFVLRYSFVIGCFVIGHSAFSVSSFADGPTARINLSPADTAFVGQYVRVNIDVLYPGEFTSAPTFDLPEVEGGVMLRMDSQGVHGSEQIDGQSWHSVKYNFALFPHRQGTCTVPPVRLRFTQETGSGPVHTEPVSIEAKFPQGAEGLDTLVCTPGLEARETWNPDATELKVGDAITRAITLKAERVLGMGFPAIPVEEVDGLGVYPEDPVVQDTIDRGQFKGERTESVTYVCEHTGKFELPSIVIPWFDLSANLLKHAEFPARTLRVAGNPDLNAAMSDAGIGSGSSDYRFLPVIAMVLVLAVLVVAWRFRIRLKSTCEAWRIRRHESEAAYFNRFLRAARSGEPGAALQGLLSWLDRSGAGGTPPSVSGFLSRVGDPELSRLLGQLMDVLYGAGERKWASGNQLGQAVRNARSAQRRNGRDSSMCTARHLAQLNPNAYPLRIDTGNRGLP